MAIDEIERTEMVQKLIDTLGEKPAATLMKCVYPDGVDFLATKDDLNALEERMRSYVDTAVSTAISTALARQTRMLMVTMAGFMLTIWVPLTIAALT
ncbi:MAG: hypothetical protein OXG57_13470 [Acidimicrobiaceae bacterium]|nr:hypothetical protein [Acidimicrobiaceae bacterium]